MVALILEGTLWCASLHVSVEAEMSVIARIGVPAEDFPLGQTLRASSHIRVQLERVIPLGETAIPYLWVSDDSIDAIEAAIDADPNVDAVDIVDEIDERALVRVDWQADSHGLLDTLAESDVVLLDGVGSGRSWEFDLRFADHEAMAAFYRECMDRDISVTLERVHNPADPEDLGLDFSLTEIQRETLLAAHETGYFEVPREATLVDLSDRLGVSDTAASQRLRRGIATLVAATLRSPERTGQPDDWP